MPPSRRAIRPAARTGGQDITANRCIQIDEEPQTMTDALTAGIWGSKSANSELRCVCLRLALCITMNATMTKSTANTLG
jgi:hypothetical protein